MKNLIHSYFDFFQSKDIESLTKMFAKNVILQDWNIFAKGRKEVIEANENIFREITSISIVINNIYCSGLVAICVIDIFIDEEEKIKVVDIITFNDDEKIVRISAYKQ